MNLNNCFSKVISQNQRRNKPVWERAQLKQFITTKPIVDKKLRSYTQERKIVTENTGSKEYHRKYINK